MRALRPSGGTTCAISAQNLHIQLDDAKAELGEAFEELKRAESLEDRERGLDAVREQAVISQVGPGPRDARHRLIDPVSRDSKGRAGGAPFFMSGRGSRIGIWGAAVPGQKAREARIVRDLDGALVGREARAHIEG